MQTLMPPIDSADKLFHDGNPLTGEKGTIVTATFLNNAQGAVRDIQTELIAILTAAGIAPDKDTAGQLYASFQKLFLIRKNPFADIASDGAASISAALKNLGLGDGTSLPFGVPIPWPTSTPPSGFITMSGQTISAAQYPKLFALYGANLPDLRGQFIRGWDNGRGTNDNGRALLSSQADALQNITGNMYGVQHFSNNQANGAFNYNDTGLLTNFGTAANGNAVTNHNFDASRVARTATETRPSNVAFNYIVRGI